MDDRIRGGSGHPLSGMKIGPNRPRLCKNVAKVYT